MLTRQPTLDLADLERPALEAALEARGHPRFHAGQIFRWIYGRGVVDPSAMTDLSRELRAMLAEACTISTPAIVQREKSIDGTEKFLLRLADGRLVESVFIPDTPSMTFCISTQVGCAMACAFCLTGKMGLVRNLSTAEIVGQVRVLADALHLRDARFNIVLMGMGEPLHNYDETMKALRILADEQGFAMSPRRITLSTVGILPALEKLAREPVMPNLAISLHAPTDVQRGALVPINRKYGVADIVEACKRFPLKRRSRITFEYVMLSGVNDRAEDARRLAKLLAGLKSKVNLIPLNAAAHPGVARVCRRYPQLHIVFGHHQRSIVERQPAMRRPDLSVVEVLAQAAADLADAVGALADHGAMDLPLHQRGRGAGPVRI